MSLYEPGHRCLSNTLRSGANLLLAAMAMSGCMGGENDAPTVGEENGVGRLFLADGRPAANAKVQVYKVGAVPQPADLAKRARAADPVVLTRTDAQGRFLVGDIEKGEYNILASLDEEYAYQDSLALGGNRAPIPPDTLEDPGVVRGKVALEPQHNPRTVMVQLLGTNRFANVDSVGRFEFRDLAGGSYSVRVYTTESEYTPTFSSFRAVTGREVDIEETLRPIFTGIPAVHGLTVLYDTLTGVAHLRWNRTNHPLIQDYLLYRDAGRNAPSLTPSFAFTVDTVFADSLWEYEPGKPQALFDYGDSTERPFTWRVCPRMKTQAIGPFLHAFSLKTFSPKWVHTQASMRLSGPSEDLATIRDTVSLVLSFLNPLHRIKTIRWYDDPKDPPLRESRPNLTLGKDTLVLRTGANPGRPILLARLTDEADVVTEKTIALRIFNDEPEVTAMISGTLPQVGDTVRVSGSAKDLGRIVKWEWSFGSGPFIQVSKPETTFTIDKYPAKGRVQAVLRATDEDGNVGTKESFVEVLAWKNLRRMPHPRSDFTATVFEGKVYLIGGAGNAVDAYDPAFDTWETKSPMKKARFGHQVAVFGDEIMVVGGRDEDSAFASCEFYNVKTDSWRNGPNLNSPRGFFGLSKHGSQLFAFQGERPQFSDWMYPEKYDSSINAWSNWNPYGAHSRRSRFSSVMVGSKTFTFGGIESGLKTGPEIRIFDFLDMPVERSRPYGFQISVLRATAVHNRYALFAGGQAVDRASGAIQHDGFEAYDTDNAIQIALGKIRPGRQRAALAVVDGKAYLFGGREPTPPEAKVDLVQVFIPPLDSVLAP